MLDGWFIFGAQAVLYRLFFPNPNGQDLCDEMCLILLRYFKTNRAIAAVAVSSSGCHHEPSTVWLRTLHTRKRAVTGHVIVAKFGSNYLNLMTLLIMQVWFTMQRTLLHDRLHQGYMHSPILASCGLLHRIIHSRLVVSQSSPPT